MFARCTVSINAFEETMKTGLLALGVLLLAGLGMAGCSNTVDGFGRDLERAGQSVQRTF
jgi:predicted small secreted protein